MLRIGILCLILGAGAGCGRDATDPENEGAIGNRSVIEPANQAAEAVRPGQPGGLPDDRTPVTEGPIDLKSAQGAGQVLQSYSALLEQKRFAEARRLWAAGG